MVGGVHEHEGDAGVQHGQLQVLSAGTPLPGQKGGRDGLAGRVGRDFVADQLLDELGLVVVDAGLAGRQPRLALNHRVVDPALAVRAVGAEAGQVGIDDVGAKGSDVLEGDAEAFGHPGPEVLDEHVGFGHQVAQDGQTLLLAEIQHDGSFAPVSYLEHGRHAGHRGPQPADDVADGGLLDLDAFGALVDQHPGGQRSGEGYRQVNDADSVEGAGHGATVAVAFDGG